MVERRLKHISSKSEGWWFESIQGLIFCPAPSEDWRNLNEPNAGQGASFVKNWLDGQTFSVLAKKKELIRTEREEIPPIWWRQ